MLGHGIDGGFLNQGQGIRALLHGIGEKFECNMGLIAAVACHQR